MVFVFLWLNLIHNIGTEKTAINEKNQKNLQQIIRGKVKFAMSEKLSKKDCISYKAVFCELREIQSFSFCVLFLLCVFILRGLHRSRGLQSRCPTVRRSRTDECIRFLCRKIFCPRRFPSEHKHFPKGALSGTSRIRRFCTATGRRCLRVR